MAGEALLSTAQMLANTPDNTTGQIDALDLRNIIISEALGVGYLEAQQNFTLPITADVWVSANTAALNLGAATHIENLAWRLDANGAWVADYTGVILSPGTFRLITLSTSGDLQKAGAGTDTYQFQYYVGATPVGRQGTIDLTATSGFDAKIETFVYEPALELPIDLRVRGVGTGDDLLFTSFRQTIQSSQV